MALPAVYTEGTLLAFMEAELGPVVAAVGLDTSDGLLEAANEVIALLGHALSEETTTAGLVKVRAFARWQAWMAAANAATTSFDLASSGDSLKLSQVFEQISRRLGMALDAAMVYSEVAAASGAGGVMVIADVGGTQSPYGWSEWS